MSNEEIRLRVEGELPPRFDPETMRLVVEPTLGTFVLRDER